MDNEQLGVYRDRIVRYMIKAAKEAKVNTSWISINEEYESALRISWRASSTTPPLITFLGDLRASNVQAFAWFGALNTIARTLLHFTVPGVPDIYQGNEIMDLSLVDPDNRRPVDYAMRARHVARAMEHAGQDAAEGASAYARTLLPTAHDGRLKLWVTSHALQLRRAHLELFARGDYLALWVASRDQLCKMSSLSRGD